MKEMTARAHLLGATRTNFVNPHGLTQDGHYSTVRDLSTIFRYALAVPKFREILGTKAVVVGVENSSRRIALHSHNRLLDSYRIPVIGKTGYTVAAKKCFVGSGSYGGREIIVAVMGSRDLWGDTRRLLEFGFDGDLPPAFGACFKTAKALDRSNTPRGRAAQAGATKSSPVAVARASALTSTRSMSVPSIRRNEPSACNGRSVDAGSMSPSIGWPMAGEEPPHSLSRSSRSLSEPWPSRVRCAYDGGPGRSADPRRAALNCPG